MNRKVKMFMIVISLLSSEQMDKCTVMFVIKEKISTVTDNRLITMQITFIVLSSSLLAFASAQVARLSDVYSTTTFYITPTNGTNPDCPTGCQCFTLDHLAQNELPKLHDTGSLSLYLLQGVHISTVTLNFVLIRQVSVAGLNAINDIITDSPQTTIELHSSNITVIEVSTLEIKHVAIDGDSLSRSGILLMQERSDLKTRSVSIKQVAMTGITLQLLLENDVVSETNIQGVLFKMSRIQIQLCNVYVKKKAELHSVVKIKHTMFLTERKSLDSSISLFSPELYDSQTVVMTLENVIFNDSLSTSSLQPIHSHVDLVKHNIPSNVHISSSNAEMIVSNSQFSGGFGSAIHARNSNTSISNCTFSGYTQGALIFDHAITLKLHIENTAVYNNSITSREMAAAGLFVSSFGETTLENCFFHGNIDLSGDSQIIKLFEANQATIHNSKFANNNGTVINAKGTALTLSGTVMFENNSAHQGGALSLSSNLLQLVSIAEHTTVYFNHNSATRFGGAIFIDSSTKNVLSENDPYNNLWCFYGPLNLSSSFKDITLSFTNNSAGKGGDHIYGNSVKNYCKFNSMEDIGAGAWRRIFHIHPNTTLSPVSSSALRVCTCDQYGKPQCANESGIFVTNSPVYPGETFSISVVVVGAEFGTTVGGVYASLLPGSGAGTLGDSQQKLQIVHNSDHCTPLTFSLHSLNAYEIIYLTVSELTLNFYGDTSAISKTIQTYRETDVIPASLLTAAVFVNVTIRSPCPAGFTLVGNPPYCDCYPQLIQNGITCEILNGTGHFSRQGRQWIGVSEEGAVLINDNCKPNHCNPAKTLVDVKNNLDTQCDFNHSGTLCGGCQEGYSIAVGSSHCLYCPSNNSAALFLFFVIAGPLLYVLIAAFDLTVTKGAVNGLLFYANIVWIYQNIIFPSKKATTDRASMVAYVFKIFIAWLNLDFGVESCFIKGLDAYWKTLLQHVFPIYIWITGYSVVLLYRHTGFQQRFPRMAQLLGKPTNVLVTLVLLSYTKFVRNIKHTFGYAILTSYPDNSIEFVWALDGNVKYLKGKHTALFVMAIFTGIAGFIFSLYIFIMGTKNSNYCMAVWRKCKRVLTQQGRHQYVEITEPDDGDEQCKAKCMVQLYQCKTTLVDMPLPLYDALFAPFNNEYKYWLGMMLFLRIALLVTFATTESVTPLNPLILVVVATVLLVFLVGNSIYKNWVVQMFEGISLGNLIFFGGGMIYANLIDSHDWRCAISSVSVGIEFLQLFGIISHRLVVALYYGVLKKWRQPSCIETWNPASVHREQLVTASSWHESLGNEDASCDDENITL